MFTVCSLYVHCMFTVRSLLFTARSICIGYRTIAPTRGSDFHWFYNENDGTRLLRVSIFIGFVMETMVLDLPR